MLRKTEAAAFHVAPRGTAGPLVGAVLTDTTWQLSKLSSQKRESP